MDADSVLREINDEYIKLNEDDIHKSNRLLEFVKHEIIDALKENDSLFNVLFKVSILISYTGWRFEIFSQL